MRPRFAMAIAFARTWARAAFVYVVLPLVCVIACASSSPPSPPLPGAAAVPPEANAQPDRARDSELGENECETVIDCIRLRGTPPSGVRWTCHLGLCAANFASRSATAE